MSHQCEENISTSWYFDTYFLDTVWNMEQQVTISMHISLCFCLYKQMSF